MSPWPGSSIFVIYLQRHFKWLWSPITGCLTHVSSSGQSRITGKKPKDFQCAAPSSWNDVCIQGLIWYGAAPSDRLKCLLQECLMPAYKRPWRFCITPFVHTLAYQLLWSLWGRRWVQVEEHLKIKDVKGCLNSKYTLHLWVVLRLRNQGVSHTALSTGLVALAINQPRWKHIISITKCLPCP